jgi:CheY-like chemotaxis protein
VANLLGNAHKVTPAGGRVTVACRRDEGRMLIEVADTGQGIDAEFLPHVFDRFTQADPSTTRRHGGLGLGLAIVRHLVELHGGTVGADSAGPGCGTTFRVHLPLAMPESTAESVLRPETSVPGARLDGVAVLLVEDDRDTLEAMTMALEAIGARVSATTSALEAMSAFSDGAPDVVVSDIGMPHEDGYALLRRMREIHERRHVPAIALTGYTRPEDRERALSAGFAAHVPKPVDPDRFVQIVVDVLREQRAALRHPDASDTGS